MNIINIISQMKYYYFTVASLLLLNKVIEVKSESKTCTTKNSNDQCMANDFSIISATTKCHIIIFFDLGFSYVSKENFEYNIKNFVYYSCTLCNSKKFILTPKSDTTMTQFEGKNNCLNAVKAMNYYDYVRDYTGLFDTNPDDLDVYERGNEISKLCPCEENSYILLATRIMDVRSLFNTSIAQTFTNSCSKLTVILLGRTDNDVMKYLNLVYGKTNAKVFNLPNFDCLNYLFYCLLPCNKDNIECLQSDIDGCIYQSNSVDHQPNDTVHVWYVLAFTKTTSKMDLEMIFSNLIKGLQSFEYNENFNEFQIKVILNSTYITPPFQNTFFLKDFLTNNITVEEIGIDIKSSVGDDGDEMKRRLSLIPWGGSAGSLGETRIGMQAVIILTNYAPITFNFTNEKGQTLEGWLYIYNSDAFNHYKNMVKNSTNFHFINSNIFDPIFLNPLNYAVRTTLTPNANTKSSSRIPSSVTEHTTNSISSTVFDKSINKKSSLSVTTKIVLFFGSAVTILTISVIVLIILRKRMQKRKAVDKIIEQHRRPSTKRFWKKKEKQTDRWELTWGKLVVKPDELGAGAYGRIFEGKLINVNENGFHKNGTNVAIKVPNKFATESVKERFLAEINLMKQISGQKNIVAMLGCITAGDRICLVLEFCANLDLLHYVKKLKNNKNNNIEINLEETQKKIKKEFFIFAWQISHGLEFLASEGVIHRDLAARNILIDADKSAKITDFGLSIQIPIFENVVTCLDTEKLPIKWLSIESLKNHEFSFKTDIWTFGIMLYEMYSYGDIPFAEIETTELLQYLEDGNRLEKPESCSNEIYLLMSKCWMKIPFERPTINELIKGFTEFLQHSTEGYGYLEVLKTSAGSNSKKILQPLTSKDSSLSFV